VYCVQIYRHVFETAFVMLIFVLKTLRDPFGVKIYRSFRDLFCIIKLLKTYKIYQLLFNFKQLFLQ